MILSNCKIMKINDLLMVEDLLNSNLYYVQNNDLVLVKTPLMAPFNYEIFGDKRLIIWKPEESKNSIYIGDLNNKWEKIQFGKSDKEIEFIISDRLGRVYFTIKNKTDNTYIYKIMLDDKFYNISPHIENEPAIISVDDFNLIFTQNEELRTSVNCIQDSTNTLELIFNANINFYIPLERIELSNVQDLEFDIGTVTLTNPNFEPIQIKGEDYYKLISKSITLDKLIPNLKLKETLQTADVSPQKIQNVEETKNDEQTPVLKIDPTQRMNKHIPLNDLASIVKTNTDNYRGVHKKYSSNFFETREGQYFLEHPEEASDMYSGDNMGTFFR